MSESIPVILETGLQFLELEQRKSTTRIIIHHSASADVSAATIHRWHLDKGWSGIGYHYVIRKNGSIERGRPEESRGAHATSANSDSIGICLTGNFNEEKPSQDQLNALLWLIKDLRKRYKKMLSVIGHKDVMATACPGNLFPWAELKKGLEEVEPVSDAWKTKIMSESLQLGLITQEHNPDDAATKWFVLAVALNLFKLIKS